MVGRKVCAVAQVCREGGTTNVFVRDMHVVDSLLESSCRHEETHGVFFV